MSKMESLEIRLLIRDSFFYQAKMDGRIKGWLDSINDFNIVIIGRNMESSICDGVSIPRLQLPVQVIKWHTRDF